jgi:DNA repair exonuclease SbcCD ATPase subunit
MKLGLLRRAELYLLIRGGNSMVTMEEIQAEIDRMEQLNDRAEAVQKALDEARERNNSYEVALEKIEDRISALKEKEAEVD